MLGVPGLIAGAQPEAVKAVRERRRRVGTGLRCRRQTGRRRSRQANVTGSSAEKVKVGVESFVNAGGPLSITGSGEIVSTVKVRAMNPDELPAGSVALTAKSWGHR